MKTRIVTACVLLFATAGAAQAESLVEGSIDDGKTRSITCGACHGQQGNSTNPLWPNLAGQNAKYLVEQLHAFRGTEGYGKRNDSVMSAQAMMLTDDDIQNLAVYYESLPAAANSVQPVNTNEVQLTADQVVVIGESLYRGGDEERKLAACMSCHGPTGRGNPASGYPSLHGQHATYTAKQLRDYSKGSRTSDGKSRQMRDIAERLTEEEIEAIASYVQGLK